MEVLIDNGQKREKEGEEVCDEADETMERLESGSTEIAQH